MQNNKICNRMTRLYGSHHSSVVFAGKTATFGSELQAEWRLSIGPSLHLWFSAFITASLSPELQVSMGLSSHLLFCAFTTATWLAPELLVSMGPRPYLSLCACKTKRLTSELLISMGPSFHLWFVHAKLQLYDQNYKSLWVPDLTYVFFIQSSDFSTRVASLY